MGSCVSLPRNKRGENVDSQQQQSTIQGVNGFLKSDKKNNSAVLGGQHSKTQAKRSKKKVHKGLIGSPSNFQHTGHIGISEMRSGKVDPEKIRNQMAEVAAALRLELMSNEVNNTQIGPVSSETPQNPIPSSNGSITSSPTESISTEPKFKIKRKPTINSIHSRNASNLTTDSTATHYTATDPLVPDPMVEAIAALKMSIDAHQVTKATNIV